MARIKGWKKINRTTYGRPFKDGGGERISINKSNFLDRYNKKYVQKYWIEKRNPIKRERLGDIFSSFSKAQEFAIRYMKSHPRG